MEAATDEKAQKEIDERMGVVQTALNIAEASVAENEDHLDESRIREEEAHQGDQGQSDSSEGQDDDIVVEGPEESGPQVWSPPPLSEAKRQSPLWRLMWMTSCH